VVAVDRSLYVASKGAVVKSHSFLALDHCKEGVRVNCVCPVPTMTPMLKSSLDRDGEGAAEAGLGVPRGRVAERDEISSVVGFLLSPKGNLAPGAVWAVGRGRRICRP